MSSWRSGCAIADPHRGKAAVAPSQQAELIERYLAGERAFELAQAFGISRHTVANQLTRAGVRRPRSMTTTEKVEAIRLHALGWSCVRIGEHLGRDHSTVWLALKAAGVRLRDNHGQELT